MDTNEAIARFTGKATSFDIAQLAGVSQPTVSRALRGSPSVSEITRKRIEDIARELNYRVDKNASSLRRKESNTLALLIFEDPTADSSGINPFFQAMLGSITRACGQNGYDLLVSFQQFSSDWHVDFEDCRKADGLILLGYGDYQLYHAKIETLIARGARFVQWGFLQAGLAGTRIGCDNVQGGYDAAMHLILQGRRRVAFVGHASDNYPEFRDRYAGSVSALKKANLPVLPALQVDAFCTEEAGFHALDVLLKRGERFDAIFAASDTIAIGVLHALKVHGLDVPEDVAVIGFDDIPAAAHVTPALTTVRQDHVRAGDMLVTTLIRKIRGEDCGSCALPADLIIRDSTAPRDVTG